MHHALAGRSLKFKSLNIETPSVNTCFDTLWTFFLTGCANFGNVLPCDKLFLDS